MVDPASRPVLSARGVSKRFGALTALSGVDLDIRRGEVLALLGGDGAGQSTFVKILAGAHAATGGEIRIEGRPVGFASPQDAAVIRTTFQGLALSEDLSVAENVIFGRGIDTRVTGPGVPAPERHAGPGGGPAARARRPISGTPGAPSAAFRAGSGMRFRSAER